MPSAVLSEATDPKKLLAALLGEESLSRDVCASPSAEHSTHPAEPPVSAAPPSSLTRDAPAQSTGRPHSEVVQPLVPGAAPELGAAEFLRAWRLEDAADVREALLTVDRRRAGHALLAVVQEAYVHGVSTRKVDELMKALGLDGVSKSEVSRMCGELDPLVEAFRTRALTTDYPYLWVDATYHKVRVDGRVTSQATVVAVGVTSEGERQVLGIDVGPSEDRAFWTAFLRSLVKCGLRGVRLVTSDAHEGAGRGAARGCGRGHPGVPASPARAPAPAAQHEFAGAVEQRSSGGRMSSGSSRHRNR